MNWQPLIMAADGPGTAAPWIRVDGLGIALATTVILLAVTVITYARRNLTGAEGTSGFFAGAAGVVVGTLVVALSGRLSLLVVGWFITSISVVVVLANRGEKISRHTAARAGRSLAVGDAALLAAAATTWWAVGEVDLSEVGATASALAATDSALLGVDVAVAVPVLLSIAALARAAQFPLHRWLPGTVNSPTPASALLHAGVVNAGGFLLVLMGPVFAGTGIAAWLVVAVTITTVLVAAGSAMLRRDIKGQLATSTSAQMAFMLLATAVGAPIAAISHLIGHAFYKSSRFLGAGDAIRRAVAHRRWTPELRSPLPLQARLATSVVGPALGLGIGWLLVGSYVLKGADGWVLASAIMVTTVRATWIWTGRAAGSRPAAAVAGSATLGAIVVAYLLVATGVELLIIDSIDRSGEGYVSAPLALGLLAAAVAIGLTLMTSERFGARVRGVLAAGDSTIRTSHRPSADQRSETPTTTATVELEGVR